MVLATFGGKTKGMTRTQIADVYAGRKTTWDDGKPIRLVLRGDQETETKVLRSISPEVDAAVTLALKRPGLPIAENDLDAIDTLTKIQGSLGSTNLGLLNASQSKLMIIPIDGVMPSAKSAEDGSYRYVRQFHLITAATPRPAVTAFLNWLNAPAALALARQLDYLPLK